MKRDFRIYLRDIVANMRKAQSFVSSMSYEQFLQDEKVRYAVERCLEIIGEATKQVPEDVRKRHPHIPWREMAGMRDKVIHFYFGIDPEKVWLTVKRDIPTLRPEMEAVLLDLENNKGD